VGSAAKIRFIPHSLLVGEKNKNATQDSVCLRPPLARSTYTMLMETSREGLERCRKLKITRRKTRKGELVHQTLHSSVG
ncbi:unnamed protein product, partial [Amoebophrya sp. A25]